MRWHSLVWKYNDKDSQAYKYLMSTDEALLFAALDVNSSENDMYYNDSYWTIGSDGKGANMLGKLLMLVRASLRKQQKIETKADLDILKGNFIEFSNIANKLRTADKVELRSEKIVDKNNRTDSNISSQTIIVSKSV